MSFQDSPMTPAEEHVTNTWQDYVTTSKVARTAMDAVSMSDAARMKLHERALDAYNRFTSAYGLLVRPMRPDGAFDAALVDYQRLRAAELAMSSGDTIEEEKALEPAFNKALAATTEAFKTMFAIPSRDGRQVAAKLLALADLYDIGSCGVDRTLLNQLMAEITSTLTHGEAA